MQRLASFFGLIACVLFLACGNESRGVPTVDVVHEALYSATATIHFTGGTAANPGCSVCSTDFSEPGLASWNGGSQTFTDPTPASLPVTKVTVTLDGVYANPSSIDVTLNSQLIGTIPASAGGGPLTCACDAPVVLQYANAAGIPGFVKGGTNTLSIAASATGLRLATATLAFEGPDATTTVLSSNTPSITGDDVLLNAAVTSTNGIPTGSVTFKEGSTTVGTGTLDGTGHATATLTGVTVGTHTYVATYGGSAGFSASTSAPLAHAVRRFPVTVTVTTDPTTIVAGQLITITVVVTPVAPRTAVPTGNVTITEGANVLGTARLSAGRVSIMASSLLSGSRTIVATTAGDATYASTTGSTTVTVNQAQTTLPLVVQPTNAALGQNVALVATVTPVAPGGGGTRSGTVTFYDGTTVLATARVFASGDAIFESTAFTRGTHAIRAEYGGSTDFAASNSTTIDLLVGKSAARVTFETQPLTPVFGDTVTIRATVVPFLVGAAEPTGTLTFFEGPRMLGSAPLVAAAAAIDVTNFGAGMHVITTDYSGDNDTAPDNTGMTSVVVAKAGCNVTASVAPSEVMFGESVAFRAIVVSPVAGPRRGAVEFRDGTISLGVADLDSNGVAVLSSAATPPGAHQISAEWPGDGDHIATVSTPVELVVLTPLDAGVPDSGPELDASVADATTKDGGVIVVPSQDAATSDASDAGSGSGREITACACRTAGGTLNAGRNAAGAGLAFSALAFAFLRRSRRKH